VKKLKHEVSTAESSTELSPNVKHKLVDEILQRLKSFEDKSNVTQLRGLCYSTMPISFMTFIFQTATNLHFMTFPDLAA